MKVRRNPLLLLPQRPTYGTVIASLPVTATDSDTEKQHLTIHAAAKFCAVPANLRRRWISRQELRCSEPVRTISESSELPTDISEVHRVDEISFDDQPWSAKRVRWWEPGRKPGFGKWDPIRLDAPMVGMAKQVSNFP